MYDMFFSVIKNDGDSFTLLDGNDNELITGMTKKDIKRLAMLLDKCVKQKKWKK